jgi:hypothetical protein
MSEKAQQSGTLPVNVGDIPKFVATIAALAYGVGFIVVSLHRASFGITQFSLLRPRVVSAGFLIIVLTAVPSIAARRRTHLRDFALLEFDSSVKKWLHIAVLLNAGFFTSLVLAVASRFLFVRYWGVRNYDLGFTAYLGAFAVFSTLVPIIGLSQRERYPRTAMVVAWVNFLAANAVLLGWFKGPFLVMIYWYLGVGLLAAMGPPLLRRGLKNETTDWETNIIGAAFLLVVLSTFIYSRVKPWFGGGLPISIEIQTTGPTPLGTSFSGETLLIDETDQGFYVLRDPSTRAAVFIPRHAVNGVLYRPAESEPFFEPVPSEANK